MAQIIGEKKADAIQVQFVGNCSILLVTQENDCNPQHLDTLVIVNAESIKNLIAKLQIAHDILVEEEG